MGNCFQPQKPLPANTYSVRVINDGNNLEGQAKGLLQVTDTDLILTLQMDRRKKIEWPLKHLRRYGCDGHIFSIEAGSKCPAGEGMYAFSTDHAQELFEVVAKTVSNRSAHHDMHSSVSDLEASSSPPVVPANGYAAANKRSLESLSQSQRQASPAAECPASPPSSAVVLKNEEPILALATNPRSSPAKPDKPLNYPPIVLEEPSSQGIVSSKPRVGYSTVNFEKTEELREKIDQQRNSNLSMDKSGSPQVSATGEGLQGYINFTFASNPNSPPNGVNTAYKNLDFSHNSHSMHRDGSPTATPQFQSSNPNYKNWQANGNGGQPSHNSYSNVMLGAQPKLQYAVMEFGSQQPGEVRDQHSSQLPLRSDTTTCNYSKVDPVAMKALALTREEHEAEKERKKHAIRNNS